MNLVDALILRRSVHQRNLLHNHRQQWFGHQAQQLVRVREELGLSDDEAHELFLDFKHSRPSKLHCPHCGESWHPD